MKDDRKSKKQLLSELAALRQRLAHLEALVARHKQTEEELQKSEQEYRSLVEESYLGIASTDLSGKFSFVNQVICNMIGYSKEEMLGKFIADFLHPNDVPNIIPLFQQAPSSPNSSIHLEFRAIHKNGDIVYLDAMPVVVKYDGKIAGFHSVITDITRRKGTEGQLLAYQRDLQSLASQLSLAEERERRRIATEVHDRISQSLAFCWMKLEEMRASAPSAHFVEQVNALNSLLKELISEARSLTFELSSPLLYSIGLEAAVEHLTEQFQARHSIHCSFDDDGLLKPLGNDVSILLFQAVRELLTNVAKHAKAHDIKVIMRSQGTDVCVTVEDDGVGFDPVATNSNGFGLFSVHERLRFLGGSFRIESAAGRGTRAILTAPLKQN
ncbi:MAG: PAS domain-containing sensor histidine kinase [Chloroflexota bacterium]